MATKQTQVQTKPKPRPAPEQPADAPTVSKSLAKKWFS